MPPAVQPHAHRDHQQAEDEKAGQHHVGKNADVGAGLIGEEINEKEKKDVTEGDQGESGPDQGDGVAQVVLPSSIASNRRRVVLAVHMRVDELCLKVSMR
jgi:hypothetical protein